MKDAPVANDVTTSTDLGDMVGTVKWFNPDKGFGFLTAADGQDFFIHYTGIPRPKGTRASLLEGARVSFRAYRGPRGYFAIDARATA